MSGKVYLIGAGPGDPELITLKAIYCLESVECVIYDYLVNQELLTHCKKGTEKIYVGKKSGQDHITQKEINDLVIQRAHAGKSVARLKGGDPFIFGRGGEEAEALAKTGIQFEIVPGISAGSAGPTYAGIPLTHRNLSHTVAFVTAHQDPTQETSNIDWDQLPQNYETLVFFMGTKNLPDVVKQLVRHGKSQRTPIALIRWGTYLTQQVITGTLETIVEQAQNVSPPTIIVVGNVVKLRNQLRWFDNRPLFGKKIVITRPHQQSVKLKRELRRLGADVISFPTVEVQRPGSWLALDRAIEKIRAYHWLIFTSVHGVKYFFDRYFSIVSDIRELKGIKIAAIGPSTAKALQAFNLSIDIIPNEYCAEGLLESFKEKTLKGMNILMPRAKVARELLPEQLRKQQANVDVVTVYETILPDSASLHLNEIFYSNKPDMIVFTSSSTVKNLETILQPWPQCLEGMAIACIGPITKKTAEERGLKVDVIPKKYITASLLESITEFFTP